MWVVIVSVDGIVSVWVVAVCVGGWSVCVGGTMCVWVVGVCVGGWSVWVVAMCVGGYSECGWWEVWRKSLVIAHGGGGRYR